MSLGSQISLYRKKAGLTQQQLAEILDVSFQAVSSWERETYLPDTEKLSSIAKALHTTVGKLIDDSDGPAWELRDRIFDEDHMYTFLKSAARAKNLSQTLAALPYARDKHKGQYRKGEGQIPYIIHPLMMACHALAMGLEDDDILTALLFHDIVEDCGVSVAELPASDAVKKAVSLVSHNIGYKSDKQYFDDIKNDPLASLIKCIDRVNNLSQMATGFTHDKMVRYVVETENYIVPLLTVVKNRSPEWNNAAWLLRYHLLTALETYKRLL